MSDHLKFEVVKTTVGSISVTDDIGVSYQCTNGKDICDRISYYYVDPVPRQTNVGMIHNFKVTHNDNGPASFYFNEKENKYETQWIVHGKVITQRVEQWIKDSNIRPWQEWTNTEKVLFKLKFCINN